MEPWSGDAAGRGAPGGRAKLADVGPEPVALAGGQGTGRRLRAWSGRSAAGRQEFCGAGHGREWLEPWGGKAALARGVLPGHKQPWLPESAQERPQQVEEGKGTADARKRAQNALEAAGLRGTGRKTRDSAAFPVGISYSDSVTTDRIFTYGL